MKSDKNRRLMNKIKVTKSELNLNMNVLSYGLINLVLM